MNEILINILSVLVSAVVLPLISIAGTYFIKWISTKINNQEASRILTEATTLVMNAVREVTQTYVDSLKTSGSFDEKAQNMAFNKAKSLVLSKMSVEVQNFLTDHYGDISKWIESQIEVSINILKSK